MTNLTIDAITLTANQEQALQAFNQFLMDPLESVFVLSGYSGCGKSTLVRILLDQLPAVMKMARLINPNQQEFQVELTATTNKAAENLSHLTNHEVKTIHSFLKLKVETNFQTGVTSLTPRNNEPKSDLLLFIDEASYIDRSLLSIIFKLTTRSKIVFIGDPSQLIPIQSTEAPVFNASFTGAELTEVVRQSKNNPIVELSTQFRNTVQTGKFFKFVPDGNHVQRLDRNDFNAAILQEFSRKNWKYQDSKILAWTNKCVISYNKYVRNHVEGDPNFQTGDYAVCNSFISVSDAMIKTDQIVQITSISEDCTRYGVLGNYYGMDHKITAFQPKTLELKKARIKQAKDENEMHLLGKIETEWIDLRAVYASTINKAQGSTFDEVFIDLDDISKCNLGDAIARMLYVAVSRARNKVYLTGDFA